jgi:hypothetical protein
MRTMQWDQKIGDFTPEDNSVIFGLTASSVSVFILKLRWPVEKPVMGKAPMSEVTKSDNTDLLTVRSRVVNTLGPLWHESPTKRRDLLMHSVYLKTERMLARQS